MGARAVASRVAHRSRRAQSACSLVEQLEALQLSSSTRALRPRGPELDLASEKFGEGRAAPRTPAAMPTKRKAELEKKPAAKAKTPAAKKARGSPPPTSPRAGGAAAAEAALSSLVLAE